MSTAQSHVLNCELYKVLVMKVDELHSTVTGIEDINELRSENMILRLKLAVSEDARAQAKFKIIKSKTIQKLSVSAWKQFELKLKVYEDMVYAKYKQLAEALAELLKAKEFLVKLGASGYTDPKDSTETSNTAMNNIFIVGAKNLHRLNQWLPDDETKTKIGTFAAKFAKNAGLYALQEGYKLVPGGVAVSNIVSKTIKEVKHETLNDIPKLLEERVSTPGKQFTGARKLVDRAEMQLGSLDRVNVDSIDNQKPEDVIRIFMMKEFFGTRFFDDLMVPKMRRGKKPE
ncbi:Uncharacterized protein Fot_37859 [Forsythia ovata]|uniref:Uncharacterized protein n=1 Tax=Forsythia ovata TaxID=205694 RepID=A0ABD1S0B1_9LAMI